MKIILVPALLAVATLLAPMAAQAEDADSDRMHPVTFVKDSAITAKVKTMLADEKMSSLVKIHVDTDSKGDVALSGTAPSQDAIDKAMSITRGVKGVNSVTSTVQIKKDD